MQNIALQIYFSTVATTELPRPESDLTTPTLVPLRPKLVHFHFFRLATALIPENNQESPPLELDGEIVLNRQYLSRGLFDFVQIVYEV